MLLRLLPALFLFVLVSCKVDPGTKTRKMIQRHADIALKPAIDEAAERKIRGMVVVSFIVEKDGSLTNVKIEESLDPSIDQQVLDFVKSLPNWKPAMVDGKPVALRMLLPMEFDYK